MPDTIFCLAGRGDRRDFDRRRMSPPMRERDMRGRDPRDRDPRDYREAEYRDRMRERDGGRMPQGRYDYR